MVKDVFVLLSEARDMSPAILGFSTFLDFNFSTFLDVNF